jgi:predicted transcriptional regulator
MITMYRNSYQITEDILSSVQDMGKEGAKITTIMRQSNLPHGRMSKFIDKLIGGELINKIETKGKYTFIITPKGRVFLEKYRKLSHLTESFGLEM